MRLNDKSAKEMYVGIGNIQSEIGIIKEKCTSMEKHLGIINGRLNKHADEIKCVQVKQEGFQMKMWILLLVGGGAGGIIGTIITRVLMSGVGV